MSEPVDESLRVNSVPFGASTTGTSTFPVVGLTVTAAVALLDTVDEVVTLSGAGVGFAGADPPHENNDSKLPLGCAVLVLELAAALVIEPAEAAVAADAATGTATEVGSEIAECPAVGERGAMAAATEGSGCVDNVNAGTAFAGGASSALTGTGDSAPVDVTEPRGVCSAEDD